MGRALRSMAWSNRFRGAVAVGCVLLVTGAAVLLLFGSRPGGRIAGRELLVAAGFVPFVLGVLRAPAAARRSQVPLLVPGCAWLTAGLLLIGLAGVLGPAALLVPGTVMMCAAAGPAVLLGCVALLSQGPLLPLGTFLPRRRLAALAAAVAAPLALLGTIAAVEHGSAGYAARYGRLTALDLPAECASAGFCTGSEPVERGASSGGSASDDGGHRVLTVHFSDKGWARYKQYYSPYGLGRYEPGDANDPTGVKVRARVVDDHAYVTLGIHPDDLAPLGLEPLPWLAWASPAALLIPLWTGWNARMRKKGLSAGSGAGTVRVLPVTPTGPHATAGGRRPSSATDATTRRKPYRLQVTSRHVRVTVAPDGLVVEQAMTGAGGRVRWRSHLDLPWSGVAGLEFAHDHRDPVVALFVLPRQGTRTYALDSAHLATGDWAKVADAIAANTHGRVTLDLSRRAGSRVNPDA